MSYADVVLYMRDDSSKPPVRGPMPHSSLLCLTVMTNVNYSKTLSFGVLAKNYICSLQCVICNVRCIMHIVHSVRGLEHGRHCIGCAEAAFQAALRRMNG